MVLTNFPKMIFHTAYENTNIVIIPIANFSQKNINNNNSPENVFTVWDNYLEKKLNIKLSDIERLRLYMDAVVKWNKFFDVSD